MATQRQQNWLGQQRVDIPHLRSIESAVAADFDVLAGEIMAGKLPAVVTGFNIVQTGAIGNDAENLQLRTSGGILIHFNATESGSLLKIPLDRSNETLNGTNSKVDGSFIPNSVNFVGLDISRTADDSTSDTVMFYIKDTDEELPEEVPLGRTADYRIIVSTTEFSATPGVCPVAKITTDASNKVLVIEDARNLFFRLGEGGSNPSSVSPFSWPGGRGESIVGGDRSIFSVKDWINAGMTKLWEIGGGEFWFSLAADRNIRLGQEPTSFTWDGTDLLWENLVFIFDNSTGYRNEIQDQLTPSVGLTNLLDGECLYVDLDRTQNLAGGSSLVPLKGPLSTLGGSSRPGQRWVLAWRDGTNVYVRDRATALGGASSGTGLATTTEVGDIRTSIDPLGGWDITDPIAVGLAAVTGNYTATASGLSHNLDYVTGNLNTAGDLLIGRGDAAGDENIIIETDSGHYTEIAGDGAIPGDPAFIARSKSDSGPINSFIIQEWWGWDDQDLQQEKVMRLSSNGVINLRNLVEPPTAPFPTSTAPARCGFYFTTNGLASPNTRDQFEIIWHDGSVTVVAQSPTY